ncbi:hypothetical protein [Aquitalea aquatica]|nr:hypothetical protein [Aquitalea magnusonii]
MLQAADQTSAVQCGVLHCVAEMRVDNPCHALDLVIQEQLLRGLK